MQQNIELYIDELVLHGFSAHHAAHLGDAVQQELTRLLQERGIPTGLAIDASVGRLNAGNVILQPEASPQMIGQNIASSVYNGLTK